MGIKKKGKILLAAALLTAGAAVLVGLRTNRLYNVATDWKTQIRYLIESGGTIGEAPASETFSSAYLEAIFGGDPQLLDQLKRVIARGLSDDPTLSLGEVSAMIVSYRRNKDGQIEDVVAHVAGGFPLNKSKPGFHRDGFFRAQLTPELWHSGNSVVGFLGRDMLIFADEIISEKQKGLIESILRGDILPLAEDLANRPLFYTAVFPDPKRVVPPQLRPHIQAVIIKGTLSPSAGSWDAIFLSPSSRSANYALSIISDLKVGAMLALRVKLGGGVKQTKWGPQIESWWAYEVANTLEASSMEKDQNLVRIKTSFERIMVNAVLKSVERMGRDLAMIRGIQDERQDPRVVLARMKNDKPLSYWSTEHRDGPNWPIPAPTNVVVSTSSESPAL